MFNVVPVTPLDPAGFALPETPPLSGASVEKRGAVGEEEIQAKRTRPGSPSQVEREKERKVKEKRPAPQPPAPDKPAAKSGPTNKPKDSSANVPRNGVAPQPSDKPETTIPTGASTAGAMSSDSSDAPANSANDMTTVVGSLASQEEPQNRDLKRTSSPQKKVVANHRPPSSVDVQPEVTSKIEETKVQEEPSQSTTAIHQPKGSTAPNGKQHSSGKRRPKEAVDDTDFKTVTAVSSHPEKSAPKAPNSSHHEGKRPSHKEKRGEHKEKRDRDRSDSARQAAKANGKDLVRYIPLFIITFWVW